MHVLIGTKSGVTYPKEGDAPPVKLSDVAFWNEFGTEKIPARPAFRVGTENAVKIQRPDYKISYEFNRPKNVESKLKQLENLYAKWPDAVNEVKKSYEAGRLRRTRLRLSSARTLINLWLKQNTIRKCRCRGKE